ncbi:MAG: C-GCAxxG-C-C family protein [Candidatus Bathyarchaeota archaeon]|nr:C-GCAxxG-C-C family protein [Candidatus Bathyarchaeota archaeon]
MTENNVSRRDFMKMAGAAVGGLAIGAVGGYSIMPPKETIVTNEVEVEVEVPQEVPEYPWTYEKLDVEEVKNRAYNAYFESGCSYGAFEAIIGGLKEKVGFPYTSIPTKMAVYGKGGTVGWGTLCGAINGAIMAMNLVSSDLSPVNELVGEYTETAYPTWKPAVAVKTDEDLPTSEAGSPLCHVSVTKWCEASGFGSGSIERKERCGRLTAEVAGRAAEMLNAVTDGNFVPVFQDAVSVTTCNGCHGDAGPIANVHAKSDCAQCHTDEPHETS